MVNLNVRNHKITPDEETAYAMVAGKVLARVAEGKEKTKPFSLPEDGSKPLKHLANVFSERVENRRLVYKADKGALLLICFKSRD